jgi:anti-anti-sigma factor
MDLGPERDARTRPDEAGAHPARESAAMSEIDSPHLRVRTDDGAVVLHLLDRELRFPEQIDELKQDLVAVVHRVGEAQYLVEMGHTRYLCSSGFAMFINLAKTIAEAGGVMAICGMNPDVRIGADIIRLGDIVPIFADQDAAIAALATTGWVTSG